MSTRFFGIFFAGATIILGGFGLTVVAHELTHFVSTVAVGVPFGDVRFSICGTNPCVIHPPLAGWRESVVGYSGGFVASILMGGIWLAGRRWLMQTGSIASMILVVTAFVLGIQQFGNGLIEGMYPDRYGRGDLFISYIQTLIGMVAIVGSFWVVQQMNRERSLLANGLLRKH